MLACGQDGQEVVERWVLQDGAALFHVVRRVVGLARRNRGETMARLCWQHLFYFGPFQFCVI